MGEQIALGLGNNIDYEIVWDSKVLESKIVQYGIGDDELSSDGPIDSERDLTISILSFLKAGTGGERFVATSEIIERFSHHFENKITLGGTSVRAAIAMRKLGYTSALHLATINDHVRRLIPQDSPYVCSNTMESLHPHLIVQFDRGTRINAGDICIDAARANRIIYHSDEDNIVMALNEAFGHLVTDAKVFLISGFNAMQSETLLNQRLDSLQQIMSNLPPDAWIFYEDAGYYNSEFSRLVFRRLAEQISVVSLNEDELQAYLGRDVDVLDAVQMAQAMADLRAIIPAPVIVVHSMYWALAYGEDAGRFASALKGGVTMATTRFRHGDDFTEADYRAIETLSPNAGGTAFADEIEALLPGSVCCVPVAHVEQAGATTVGLGDAFVGGFLPELVDSTWVL